MAAPDKNGKQHQRKYENNVVDTTVVQRQMAAEFDSASGVVADPIIAYMGKADIEKTIEYLKTKMVDAAKSLNFIEAAQYRDEIIKLTEKLHSND